MEFERYLPKYAHVKKRIVDGVLDGTYPSGSRLPAQEILRSELGVTKATLGRAVAELVREGVLATTTGVGTFVALRRDEETSAVAVVMRDLANPYNSKFVNTLVESASKRGTRVTLNLTGGKPERGNDIVTSIINDSDDVVFLDADLTPTIRKLIKSDGHRFFVFGPAPELKGLANVITADFRQGTAKLTRFLLERGHERVAYVGGKATAPYSRYAGYSATFRDHGLEVNEDLVVELGDFEAMKRRDKERTIKAAVRGLLEGTPKPTAILCQNDLIATHVVSVLHHYRRRVPEDMSVCGFDGALEGFSGTLRLTATVRPLKRYFQIALDLIAERRTSERVYHNLDPELRIGNSVKRIKRKSQVI